MHRSEEDMVKIAPKVRYEWTMLCESMTLHFDSKRVGANRSQDAFLECFLIHARNLLAFFRTKRSTLRGKQVHDVVAEDFFDSESEWNCPSALPFLTLHLERLHQSLAHITYHRISFDKKKNWVDLHAIRAELEECWKGFLNSLHCDRKKWFN